MLNNPFLPQALVGRDAEFQQLRHILSQDGDLLLVGAPGSGRRSLLREAARAANARIVDIDCLRSTGAGQFLRLLANGITDRFCTPEAVSLLQRWGISYPVTVELTSASQARIVWHSPADSAWPLFDALLALPQFLSETLDCRVVMVFRNFPHIRSWDRQGKWETHLRQQIQHHSRVSYALLATVVEPWARDSPLEVLHLLPLADGDVERWIVETMQGEGLRFSPIDRGIALFLAYVQGHLGDAIALARRIWLDHKAYGTSEGTIQAHQVHRSMVALADDMAVTFESLVMLLPPTQVRVLESLALDPTDSPQSRDYIKKHRLSRGGSLQGALNSLEQKGLIYGPSYGYRVALPILDFWLKQRLL